MLRTTNKKVKATIKNYINESVADWADDNLDYLTIDEFEELKTYEGQCNLIIDKFLNEMVKNNKNTKYYSYYDLFVKWCEGQPSVLETAYYLHSAKSLLADWLEETPEEASRYTELEAESRITQLLWREITKHASIAL